MTDDELGKATLVGTNHVSTKSAHTVRQTIRDRRPDVVAIELDRHRFDRKREDRDALDLVRNLVDDARTQSKAAFAFSQGVRLFQTNLANDNLEGPGDMWAATNTAEALGIDVALIDAPFDETVEAVSSGIVADLKDGHKEWTDRWSPAWSHLKQREMRKALGAGARAFAMNLWENVSLQLRLLRVRVAPTGLSDPMAMAESIQTTDQLRAVENVLAEQMPRMVQALSDDRNAHMAGRIRHLQEQGHDVVAVVGALHTPGIEDYLTNAETIPAEHLTEPEFVEAADD